MQTGDSRSQTDVFPEAFASSQYPAPDTMAFTAVTGIIPPDSMLLVGTLLRGAWYCLLFSVASPRRLPPRKVLTSGDFF